MEAIQAATSKAVECLGISKCTGAIRPGFEADLIVLDHNPVASARTRAASASAPCEALDCKASPPAMKPLENPDRLYSGCKARTTKRFGRLKKVNRKPT
jgi:hypothetical protein